MLSGVIWNHLRVLFYSTLFAVFRHFGGNLEIRICIHNVTHILQFSIDIQPVDHTPNSLKRLKFNKFYSSILHTGQTNTTDPKKKQAKQMKNNTRSTSK